MKSETIADIVREMRLHTRCSAADAFYDIVAWTKLCDRIEEAEKREISNEFGASSYVTSTLLDRARKLEAENDHLRAALKPVLNVGFKIPRGHGKSGMIHFKDILEQNRQDAVEAVREAQRIYKEGEAND